MSMRSNDNIRIMGKGQKYRYLLNYPTFPSLRFTYREVTRLKDFNYSLIFAGSISTFSIFIFTLKSSLIFRELDKVLACGDSPSEFGL